MRRKEKQTGRGQTEGGRDEGNKGLMEMSQRETETPHPTHPQSCPGFVAATSLLLQPEQGGDEALLASVNFTTVSLPFQRPCILCKWLCAKCVRT